MFIIESSYVSSLGSYVICICFVVSLWEWDEWPSPKDSESLSFPSLHSLLMWLHFMFDLSRSPPFFVYSLFHCHLCHCLWFISFVLPLPPPPLVLFLHWPIPDVTFPFHRSCISHYQFDLPHCLVIHIIFTLGILKSTAHGIYYTCCISYMRAWVLIIGYLSLVSFCFFHPITLSP